MAKYLTGHFVRPVRAVIEGPRMGVCSLGSGAPRANGGLRQHRRSHSNVPVAALRLLTLFIFQRRSHQPVFDRFDTFCFSGHPAQAGISEQAGLLSREAEQGIVRPVRAGIAEGAYG